MEKPEINVSYMVTIAETKEEAEFEALPQDISRLMLMKGKLGQTLTPEEARDYPLTEMDRMTIKENRKLHLVGDSKGNCGIATRRARAAMDLMKR